MHVSTALPEYDAVCHLLDAPSLRERVAPYVRRTDFDWAGLLAETETMSGGETLLVRIGYELWHAEKTVGLWELTRRLDPRTYGRVVDAFAIARGASTPAAVEAIAA